MTARTHFASILLALLLMGGSLGAVPSSAHADAPTAPAGSWPKFHYDLASTGFNPKETILSPATVPGLQLKWSILAGEAVVASVIANGVVYAHSNCCGTQTAVLYAVDAATGARRWSARETGDSSGLTVAGGKVFSTTIVDELLHAYDARTGFERWAVQGDLPWSAPVVVGSVLYASTSVLWAIRASDGAVLWKGRDIIDGQLAYANGLLYATSLNACVLAADPRTGRIQWKTCPGGEIDSTPTVVGGRVFVATRGLGDGTEYAIDAITGAVLWTGVTLGENFSSAAAANGLIYVGTAGGTEYAFPQDCVTPCQPVWTFKGGDESGHFPADASVANGVVYTGTTSNTIVALDAMTGAQLWSSSTDRYFFEPAVVDGVVYVGTADGHLDAFSLPGGSP